VFAEVFPNSNALRVAAQHSWAARQLKAGSKIDSAAVEEIFNGTKPAKILDDLVEAQNKADELFRGSVLKQFAGGAPMDIPAEKFVSSFLYQSSNQQVKDVMAKVSLENPELARQIERSTLTDLFLKAQRKPAAGRPMTDGGAWQLADPNQLRNTMAENADKLQAVLSPVTFQKLEGFISMLKTGERRDVSGGMAGGFAAGKDMAELPLAVFKGGEGLLPKIGRQVAAGIVAAGLTNPKVERLLSNQLFRQRPELEKWSLFFLSTPVIRDLIDTYGEDQAQKIGQALNEGMGRAARTQSVFQQAGGP